MTEPVERSLATLTHGRYLVDDPGIDPSAVLVGFYGYGEAAEESLAALRRLAEGRSWLVVAVQGLHAFYERRTGGVVASWMTRQQRELAIADNVAWVARVLAEVRSEHPATRRLGLVGFSQGVAMAYRAAARSGHEVAALVAMAGDVPPELDPELPRLPPVLIGRGRDDDWYTEEKMEGDLDRLRRAGARAEAFVFDGGHSWSPAMVERARSFLARHLRL